MKRAEEALYAFTDCEISLSPSCTVIRDGVPLTLSISQVLVENAERTKALLKKDLEIQAQKLNQQWHLKNLVKIFIENRIYLRIEKCETWVDVLFEIDKGLEPHLSKLRQPVTEEDLVYLTEVRMRRISKWDSKKAEEEIAKIDEEIKSVRRNLRRITIYAIRYLDHLLKTYAKDTRRRTKVLSFDTVRAAAVVERTEKLYLEPKAGFIGTDLKDAQEIGSCSSLDDVMLVLEDGGLLVTKVADRKYVGENVRHAQLFGAEDRDSILCIIYEDLAHGRTYAKRFKVGGFTRDRRYELGSSKQTRILFISSSERCFVHVKLKKKPRIKTDLYLCFDDILVKGRSANGVVLTKHKVSRVKGISEAVYSNRVNPASEEPSSAKMHASSANGDGKIASLAQRREQSRSPGKSGSAGQPLLFPRE
jgi:topoisomerase-4 subunit A